MMGRVEVVPAVAGVSERLARLARKGGASRLAGQFAMYRAMPNAVLRMPPMTMASEMMTVALIVITWFRPSKRGTGGPTRLARFR